jgi:hypothetical protein
MGGVFLTIAALAGCTSPGAGPPTEPETPTGSTKTVSSAPSSPVPTSPSATTLTDMLLTVEAMPDPNGTRSWTVTLDSNREGTRPFGVCSRFEMTSIGAETVALRTLADGAGTRRTTAGELVGRFPDVATAQRALTVLQTWYRTCRERLPGHMRTQLHPLTEVALSDPSAQAWSGLVAYGLVGGPSTFSFNAEGIVRSGATIAVLQISSAGRHLDRPPDQRPITQAIRAAAALLS